MPNGQPPPTIPGLLASSTRLGAGSPVPYSRDDYQHERTPSEMPGFVEYWRMVRGHKFLLAGSVVLSVVLVLAVGLASDPLYEGRVVIELLETNADFLNLRSLDPTASSSSAAPDAYVTTRAKTLESRALVAGVVDRLNFAESPSYQREERLTAWTRRAGLRIDRLPWFRSFPPRERAINDAMKSLRVRTTPANRIIEVSFEWTDPETAATFANTLAKDFVSQNIQERWKAAQDTGEWLGAQLSSSKAGLEKLEAYLQGYSRNTGLLFTSEKDNVAEEKLRQTQADLGRAQLERVQSQTNMELAQSGGADSLPEVLDSPQLREYELRLTDLRRQLTLLNLTLTPTHYQVVRLKAQVEELEQTIVRVRGNIIARIRNEYEKAERRESLLTAAYQAQTRVVTDQAGKLAHYNVLKREVETSRRMYDNMLERVRDAGVAGALRANNIRIVDFATPATRPSKPRLMLNAMGGVFFGLFAGIGIIFARERTNGKLRDPEEIGRYLGTSDLGFIPAAEPLMGRWREAGIAAPYHILDLSGNGRGNGKPLLEFITWHERPSVLAESFRSVLTSLLSATGMWLPEPVARRPRSSPLRRQPWGKVIVLSSPAPKEGKTTVVTNLAIALTEIGRRVVVIDCDLRRPRIHKIFDVPNDWGVTSLVSGDVVLEDCPLDGLVQATTIPSLFVLPSGPGTASISNVLNSRRMAVLIARLRTDFDAILIDTPPLLQFADARLLSRNADGLVLVVRANCTDRSAAIATRLRLLGDGIRVLGAVMNDLDSKHSGYDYDRYACAAR